MPANDGRNGTPNGTAAAGMSKLRAIVEANPTPPLPRVMGARTLDEVLAKVEAKAASLPLSNGQREAEAESRAAAERCARFTSALTAQLGKRYGPERATLDRFEVESRQQRAVLHRMRELHRNLNALIEKGRGIVWYGGPGTGKDHLQAALLYRAADLGIECRWINGQGLYRLLRDRMQQHAEQKTMQEFVAPSVLAISDPVPPIGEVSAWQTAFLQDLIDQRYRQERPVWMTINMKSASEGDDLLSPPLWDRIQDSAELIHCEWESYRAPRRCTP